jgi:hypothetical protein
VSTRLLLPQIIPQQSCEGFPSGQIIISKLILYVMKKTGKLLITAEMEQRTMQQFLQELVLSNQTC